MNQMSGPADAFGEDAGVDGGSFDRTRSTVDAEFRSLAASVRPDHILQSDSDQESPGQQDSVA